MNYLLFIAMKRFRYPFMILSENIDQRIQKTTSIVILDSSIYCKFLVFNQIYEFITKLFTFECATNKVK